MDYSEARERLSRERSWVQKGNPRLLERHLGKGKQHVSSRIRALIDDGTWMEYGEFARSVEPGFKERSPRDGIMTGLGKIHGSTVAILGDDVTVLGATQSFVNGRKVDRIIEIATKNNFPIISLSEGGGVRVPDGMGAGFTRLCGLHKILSLSWLANKEKRPFFLCAVFGCCYGDPALRAGMADITIMVEDSAIALSSPPLLKAAISEEITDAELGGPRLHETVTGTVDMVVPNEQDCIEAIKRIFHILRPPEIQSDPPDRLIPDLEHLVPSNNRKVYDMTKVIDRICDNREWIELKAKFGKGILVGIGRIGGQAAGILASQPQSAGGSVDAKGLRKSAAFLELITKIRIPLVVIQDIPGFLIGSAVERDAMINAVARHSGILDRLDIPIITLIIRKAYGAAYYFMGMGASGAQFVAAWPNTEISFMAPEMGAAILTKHAAPEMKQEAVEQRTAELRRSASIWDSAYEFWVDAVIYPEESRKVICQALGLLAKRV